VTQLTVDEASAAYAGAMRNVQPAGPGFCATCKTFIAPGYTVCFPCLSQPGRLDAVVPITYSEHLGQVHDALRGYKDGVRQVRAYAAPRLNGILWRFTSVHERCVATEADVDGFEIVTTVPSSTPTADDQRSSLRDIVQACGPLQDRFERVLRATGEAQPGREYDERRYAAERTLDGENVLLIDDTWTRGGHAQSAAHALKEAGAGAVGLVVIGRHVRPEWEVDGPASSELLAGLPRVFDWDSCCVHRS
jgi:predicted amidophosphoribosyltransferase